MPNLASVLKYFPTPFENTLAMTLNGTIAPGATTVAINNLGNYTNGQVVVFIVDAGTTAKQVFTGTVSGGSVVNVVWTYGTNVSHADGTAVADYVTATDFGMMSKGIQVQHNQDGTHGNVTSTSLVNTGALTQTGATTLNGSWDGWIGANEAWSFASSTTITVPTDATTKYAPGDWLKITQSATVKHFVITGVSATVLTVSGVLPTGTTVANSAITANAYSKTRNPGVTLNGVLPYNPYKFSVYRNSAQNTGNGSFAIVNFDTKLFDTGSNFDAVTNHYFTAPVAGFYQFNWGIKATTTAGTTIVVSALYQNGAEVQDGNLSEASTATGISSVGSALIQCAANDTLAVYAQASGAYAIVTGKSTAYFSGFLMSAT